MNFTDKESYDKVTLIVRERTYNINIDPNFINELEYRAKLMGEDGFSMDSANTLIEYLFNIVAEGSRRPDSWQREMLSKMGMISEASEKMPYRDHYGDPDEDILHCDDCCWYGSVYDDREKRTQCPLCKCNKFEQTKMSNIKAKDTF